MGRGAHELAIRPSARRALPAPDLREQRGVGDRDDIYTMRCSHCRNGEAAPGTRKHGPIPTEPDREVTRRQTERPEDHRRGGPCVPLPGGGRHRADRLSAAIWCRNAETMPRHLLTSTPPDPDPRRGGPAGDDANGAGTAAAPKQRAQPPSRPRPQTPASSLFAALLVAWVGIAGVGGPYFGKISEVATNDRSIIPARIGRVDSARRRIIDEFQRPR
jgi:hypothetical protein